MICIGKTKCTSEKGLLRTSKMLLLLVVVEQKYSESPAREVDIMAMIMIMSLKYLSSYILLLRNGSFL